MLNDVHTAGSILKQAIDNYLAACLTLSGQYKPRSMLKSSLDSGTITSELEQIASFERKIEQTKKALGKLRNSFREIAPINSLPPEILSCIFHLTHTPGRCLLQDPDDMFHYPSRTPESLPQVCSYWRALSLNTRSLWTHIDLFPEHKLTRQIIRRAELFAARSGQLSLTVHVEMSGSPETIHHEAALLGLCFSVATRATSIQLLSDCSAASRIIQSFLVNATPGKLVQLDLRGNKIWERSDRAFLVARDRPLLSAGGIMTWRMGVPQDELEAVLRHITVLRLDRVFPYWTSRVYHGLTKLHLADLSDRFITISHLAEILRSSPQLRFLHLGAGIRDDTTPESVRLDDLEVLHLELDQNQHDPILDLIQPGLKPLRMSSITHNHNLDAPDLTEGGYRRFFERANVAQLHIGYPDNWKQLDLLKLLQFVPNVRALSIDSFQVFNTPEYPLELTHNAVAREFQLELCVVGGCINFDAFRRVTKALDNVDLMLDKTCWIVDEDGGGDDVDAPDMMDELTMIYPGVRLVDDWSPPEEDWD